MCVRKIDRRLERGQAGLFPSLYLHFARFEFVTAAFGRNLNDGEHKFVAAVVFLLYLSMKSYL